MAYEEKREGYKQAQEEVEYLLGFWTYHWEIFCDLNEHPDEDRDEAREEYESYMESLDEIPDYQDNGGDSPEDDYYDGGC